jgi:hypothetical protein
MNLAGDPGRRKLLAPMAVAAALTANDILTVGSDGAAGIRVTTAAAHGLTDALAVVLSGTSEAAYNDTPAEISNAAGDTFDIAGIGYVGDATGGTWALS